MAHLFSHHSVKCLCVRIRCIDRHGEEDRTTVEATDRHALLSFTCTGGDTMTTEMQEIAITEEKPLLTGQADAKVRDDGAHTYIREYVHTCCTHGLHANTHTCRLKCFPSMETQTHAH